MVGTVIVVGSAGCVHDDLARLPTRDMTWVAAVNGGCIVTACDFLMSQHPDKLGYWRDLSRAAERCWPETHSARPPNASGMRDDYPWVDYWWPQAHNQASSAWTAVRICKLMGFDEIILAGCPLDPREGYFDGEDNTIRRGMENESRFGNQVATKGFVLSMQESLRMYVEQGEGHNVFSMSGYTRELLGEPTPWPQVTLTSAQVH